MTREERNLTIEYLKDIQEGYIEGEGYERHPLPEWYALNNAVESLEQESIFDKIKAEITERYSDCDICDYDDNIIFEYVRVGNILDILAIIDKYKTESEI